MEGLGKVRRRYRRKRLMTSEKRWCLRFLERMEWN
jgi:hypothetical protein